MLRRSLTAVIFGALALLACAARAEACSCAGPDTPCAALGAAEAVFVGTVSEVSLPRRDAAEKLKGLGRPVARFVVEESFAGVSGADEVSVAGGSGADCGYAFVKGTRYLVYAERTQEGGLSAFLCSRTAPAQEAAGDLDFLRALMRQPPGGTISGRVGRALDEWDERTGLRKLEPVEGVRLTVAGRGALREVPLDAAGRYKLTGLPPGSYHVEVHLREGLTVAEPRKSVEAVERGCAAADFYIMDDGRIGGRVLDAGGNPVPRITVTLLGAGEQPTDLNRGRHTRADEEGRYKFSALPPGRYLLGVRLWQPPSLEDPAAAFPRTYYPGVAGAAEAEVVELKAGEELMLGDLRLPPRLAEAVVRARVVWDDGTPAAGAYVSYRETTYGGPPVDQSVQADAQGQTEVRTRVGTVFRIEARTLLPLKGDPAGTGGTLLLSEPQTLTVADAFETVTLVIKRPK